MNETFSFQTQDYNALITAVSLLFYGDKSKTPFFGLFFMCLAAFQQLILSTKQKACNNLLPSLHNQSYLCIQYSQSISLAGFPIIYVNPLCTLYYIQFSIPKTLTKMRKKYGASFENLFCIAGIDRIHIYSTSNNT